MLISDNLINIIITMGNDCNLDWAPHTNTHTHMDIQSKIHQFWPTGISSLKAFVFHHTHNFVIQCSFSFSFYVVHSQCPNIRSLLSETLDWMTERKRKKELGKLLNDFYEYDVMKISISIWNKHTAPLNENGYDSHSQQKISATMKLVSSIIFCSKIDNFNFDFDFDLVPVFICCNQ